MTPWTVACQAPLSVGFSRHQYWSGMPVSPPRDLPDPRIKPMFLASPALQANSLPTNSPGKQIIGLGYCEPGTAVELSSVAQLCLTLCDPMDCSTPVHHQFPELTQTHVHQVSDAIQPSHPLSSPSPPFSLSQSQVFSSESALHIRWPKIWSFSFSIRPSNEHPELISFRMDWLDLLAVQGTLKSLLQHHNSKASILGHSAFFIVNSHIHT